MTLLNGDCVPIMQMCIPDESVDLVVTSPPYDNLRQYNGIADAWDFDKFKSVASELFRVTKSGGSLCG